MIRFVLIWLALCSVSLGQIKLSELRQQTWVGFENPRVVNGVVISGTSSKPMLASSTSLITVEKVEYKFFEIEAEKLPTLETAELEQVDGGYKFREGTPVGQYRITARGFDPEKGMATKRITVEVGATPDVQPIIPDLGSGLPAESRKAMVGLVQNMASDMEALASDIKSGKVKTVLQASDVNNGRDIVSRNSFKQQMAKLMQPKIGSDVLSEDAEKTFTEISKGFRSVK